MKSYTFSCLLLIMTFVVFNCGNDDEENNGSNNTEWLIPLEEVFDGGPGKDGIPSIDNPNFSNVEDITFLSDQDLVVGVISDDEVKAYPHSILDWHEIVNDDIGDKSLAITYCPLTGTAIGWDRNVNGSKTTFGVSGKLYNSNLIPYDRNSDSYWSQIRLDCINGDLINTEINTSHVIETSWATWKELYPQSKVMNTNTDYERNYNQYPYGDYRTNNNNLIFPVNPMDDRLPSKERTLAVLTDGGNKAYSIEQFDTPKIIQDTVGGIEIIVIGSKEKNFIVAFENDSQFNNLTIQLDSLPIIAENANGLQLTIAGELIENNTTISQLKPTNSFIGFWFSLGAFYPNIELFE